MIDQLLTAGCVQPDGRNHWDNTIPPLSPLSQTVKIIFGGKPTTSYASQRRTKNKGEVDQIAAGKNFNEKKEGTKM